MTKAHERMLAREAVKQKERELFEKIEQKKLDEKRGYLEMEAKRLLELEEIEKQKEEVAKAKQEKIREELEL